MPEPDKTTILLVDDDKHLLLTLRDYLSFKGYAVSVARSAEDALQTLNSMTPDLVILDIGMPGIGGMGFLKQIRSDPDREGIPILVLTAKAIMEDFFKDLDINGFIAKPCTEEELVRKIKEVLSMHRASLVQEKKPDPKLLIVEDDATILAEVCNAFRVAPRHMDVTTAGSAAEAIEKTVTLKPDVIMANEVLQGMNGSDMARLVRQMPAVHSVPILLYKKELLDDGLWNFGHRIYGENSGYLAATDSLSLHDAVCRVLDSS